MSLRQTLFVLLALAVPAFAQRASIEFDSMREYVKDAEPPAQSELPHFESLVKGGLLKEYGFFDKSLTDTHLASGLPTFLVTVNELQRFRPGNDVFQLLRDEHTVTFVLFGNGKPLSTMTMRRPAPGKAFEPTALGSPQLAEQIDTTYAALTERQHGEFRILVEIPGMSLKFLGQIAARPLTAGYDLYLTAIRGSEKFGVKQGLTTTADDLFTRLSAAAH